jgi:hypothetical protein
LHGLISNKNNRIPIKRKIWGPLHYDVFWRTGGLFKKLAQGSETSDMTSEGLGGDVLRWLCRHVHRKVSENLRKRLHIDTVTIFKEYLIVTVTTFRKYLIVTVTISMKYLIVTVTISKKYLIVTVTMFREHLIVTFSKKSYRVSTIWICSYK